MSIAEKLVTVAENQQKVYDKGKADERNAFWEDFQQGGNRKDYNNAFRVWKDECYNPVYPFAPTNATGMYNSSTIVDTRLPIDMTKVTATNNMSQVFSYAQQLVTVNKVIVDENTVYTTWFPYCRKLTNITFEGTIGKSIDFSDCPLSVESMINVITHLKQYTGTEDAYKYTVKFSDSCWEALENSDYDHTEIFAYGETWREGLNYLGWNV